MLQLLGSLSASQPSLPAGPLTCPLMLHPGCRFGFNNHQTAMDGLYAGGAAFHTDYMWVTYQLQLLGFNAIRVPYIFK